MSCVMHPLGKTDCLACGMVAQDREQYFQRSQELATLRAELATARARIAELEREQFYCFNCQRRGDHARADCPEVCRACNGEGFYVHPHNGDEKQCSCKEGGL